MKLATPNQRRILMGLIRGTTSLLLLLFGVGLIIVTILYLAAWVAKHETPMDALCLLLLGTLAGLWKLLHMALFR